MKQRFAEIDLLRAFSIIAVIAIHTFSFSLNNSFNIFFWNFLQFVVGIFIFCSGFVHASYNTSLVNLQQVIMWYRKRFFRILLPFFYYFPIHFLLFIIFPHIFTHFGLHAGAGYIIGSLFLYGGINADWLPLLFLELTVLTPLLFLLQRRHLLWIFIFFALGVTLLGTIWPFPYVLYKSLMWIGWSLIFLFGLFAPRMSNISKKFIGASIISGILLICLYITWVLLHRPMNFIDNKYPPNLYYLSYALLGTSLSFLISKYFVKSVPLLLYEYISKNSYRLFFIHFILLDALESILNGKVLLIFIITLVGSVFISWSLDFTGRKLSTSRR